VVKKILSIIFVLLIAVSLIGGSLVGCKGTTTSQPTSTTTPLQEANITIGLVSPQTGGAAPWGLAMVHGLELAFEDANNAGGVTIGNTHYTFVLSSLDDKYDTTTATNDLRTMIYSNGVKFLFSMQTEGTMAMAPEMAQQKILNFVEVYDDAVIAQPTNSYTFRTVIPPSMKTDSYTKWIIQQYPNMKKIAHLSTNNTNGEIITQQDDASAKANSLTVVDEIYYDSGTTDFTSVLTKLLNEKPDGLFLGGTPTGDCAVIIKEARDMGFKGVISDISPTSGNDMLAIAGKDALEGFISTMMAMQPPLVGQSALNLTTRENAKYGVAYGSTWDFYSQALVICEAIKKAGSIDPTVVKALLEDSTQVWPYDTLTGGKATFGTSVTKTLYGANANHQIVNPYTISVVKDGQDTNAAVVNP
jgi:branched-chain amino acid transport system substrate-binding protein